jgi:hypothetical protein
MNSCSAAFGNDQNVQLETTQKQQLASYNVQITERLLQGRGIIHTSSLHLFGLPLGL